MSDSLTAKDQIAELAGLPTLAYPTVSPSGDAVAFYYDETGRNELYVLDLGSGEMAQWSEGEVPRDAGSPLHWSADGERVLFHRDEDGDEQYDVFAIDGSGTVDALVQSEGRNVVHDVAPGGEFLVFGSTRDGQVDLYRRDTASGDVTRLTDADQPVWWSTVSPTADRIAYVSNTIGDLDVYVTDADGTEQRPLSISADGAEAVAADWHPDGDRLLVGDNSDGLGRVGVCDLATGETTWLGDGTAEETPVQFTPDGERVLATRDRDATTAPLVYDLATGETREFDLPDGVGLFGTHPRLPRRLANDAVVDESRVLVTHTTPTTRRELLIYDHATHTAETLVAAEHGPFDTQDFVDAEYVTFASDGVPETRQAAVEHDPAQEFEVGALLYDSGERPSPLVVKPHGGPRGRDTKRFSDYTQVLTACGYSVLEVNYRGSTGRGREFVEALYDGYGGAEQGDIATGVEYVLDEYDWLDDDRVAVFGGSYGGYSAYWQLVQFPDLYDAGIAWNGLTDLVDLYEHTMPGLRVATETYLGTPAENPDLYEERSPVTHAENLDAPLLMLHAVNDRRVPISQARRFREAVDDEADLEYHELGAEGHSTTDQEQTLRAFQLLEDFLARRLGAGESEQRPVDGV